MWVLIYPYLFDTDCPSTLNHSYKFQELCTSLHLDMDEYKLLKVKNSQQLNEQGQSIPWHAYWPQGSFVYNMMSIGRWTIKLPIYSRTTAGYIGKMYIYSVQTIVHSSTESDLELKEPVPPQSKYHLISFFITGFINIWLHSGRCPLHCPLDRQVLLPDPCIVYPIKQK